MPHYYPLLDVLLKIHPLQNMLLLFDSTYYKGLKNFTSPAKLGTKFAYYFQRMKSFIGEGY